MTDEQVKAWAGHRNSSLDEIYLPQESRVAKWILARLEAERWQDAEVFEPAHGDNVLVFDGTEVFEAHHCADGWWTKGIGQPIGVTHWRPLPPGPK